MKTTKFLGLGIIAALFMPCLFGFPNIAPRTESPPAIDWKMNTLGMAPAKEKRPWLNPARAAIRQ